MVTQRYLFDLAISRPSPRSRLKVTIGAGLWRSKVKCWWHSRSKAATRVRATDRRSGKGGFRLSLRAFDAQLDSLTITQEELGRRIKPLEPERSLLLEKPLMLVAHAGGQQLRKSDVAYDLLREWIAGGAPLDRPSSPRIVKVEVFPKERRVLPAPHRRQQLAVHAHYSDGTSRDVTRLASYSSSNESVATVDANGLVQASQRGEAAILVRVLEHIETLPLMFVEQVLAFIGPTRARTTRSIAWSMPNCSRCSSCPQTSVPMPSSFGVPRSTSPVYCPMPPSRDVFCPAPTLTSDRVGLTRYSNDLSMPSSGRSSGAIGCD